MGLDIKPSAKKTIASQKLQRRFSLANRTYAKSASNAKKVLKTSLRSETQATDSTCNGCQANKAAMNALGHKASVKLNSNMKSNAALAA